MSANEVWSLVFSHDWLQDGRVTELMNEFRVSLLFELRKCSNMQRSKTKGLFLEQSVWCIKSKLTAQWKRKEILPPAVVYRGWVSALPDQYSWIGNVSAIWQKYSWFYFCSNNAAWSWSTSHGNVKCALSYLSVITAQCFQTARVQSEKEDEMREMGELNRKQGFF